MSLSSCIKEAFDESKIVLNDGNQILIKANNLAQRFKLKWFYNNNRPYVGDLTVACGAYVGLFHKNIEITDISHPELLVLIRKNTASSHDGNQRSPYFHSNFEATTLIKETLLSSHKTKKFQSDKNKSANQKYEEYRNRRIFEIVEFYGSIFSNMIIVDFNATSFSFYIPISLTLNIEKLTVESGYIHSIGNQLYVRKADRAVMSELESRIEQFIDDFECEEKVYITAYSSEFFDDTDDLASSIEHGLSNLKLSARKHHIENYSIIEAIPVIQNAIGNERLVAPISSDYSVERKKDGIDPRFTIFLMQDHSLVYSKTDRHLKIGSDIFLLCFAQRLKNENPYHIFKESKPAWIEPVTLPHTLSSAHINIALGRLKDKKIIALDPFCGTGTTLMDVGQRCSDATLIGFDRNPMSKLLVKDNFSNYIEENGEYFKFFQSMEEVLVNYCESIDNNGFDYKILQKKFTSQLSNPELLMNHDCKDFKDMLFEAVAFVLGAICRTKSNNTTLTDNKLKFDDMRVAHINQFLDSDGPFLERFNENYFYHEVISKIISMKMRYLIYTIWRAIFYNSFRFQRGISSVYNVIKKEVEVNKFRFEHFNKDTNLNYSTNEGAYEKWDGLFSPYVRPLPSNIEGFSKNASYFEGSQLSEKLQNPSAGNLLHFQVDDSIDAMLEMADTNCAKPNLIITDPPYGFNTAEDGTESLEKLFAQLANALCKIVAENGVVAITLPGQTNNGKRIPYFETRAMFVRQVIDQAHRTNRTIISKASILPDSAAFPRPAFRWNSSRGVSRHSLVFTVV